MEQKNPIRILHLEDDPFDQELIRYSIKKTGISFELDQVETRDAFLNKLNGAVYDLVLSDSSIAGIDGIEAMSTLRDRGSTAPFVFVSGADSSTHIQALIDAGATEYIHKSNYLRLSKWIEDFNQSRIDAHESAAANSNSLIFDKLVQVVHSLSMARSMEGVQSIVTRAIRELLGADGATFVLREGDECFYANEDSISPLWKGRRFLIDHCISGWAMTHRQTVFIDDIYADARIPHDAYKPTFVKSLAMAPIRTADPIGALGSYWANQIHPTPFQVSVLQSLANSCAITIENLNLNTNLESLVAVRTAELKVANKELENFVSAVSHDLRAPIRHIDGFAKLMLADPENKFSEKSSRYFELIIAAAHQMSRLIDDLTKLSRTVLLPVERQTFNLSKMAEHATIKFIESDRSRNVEFRFTKDIEVSADPHLMEIVIENLISNAWKFTSKIPMAVIEVGSLPSEQEKQIIFVRDNGAGFDTKHAKNIFTPFARAHREPDYPGTGIGLSTVYRIIKKHGGNIWFEAEVDKGACFYFTVA